LKCMKRIAKTVCLSFAIVMMALPNSVLATPKGEDGSDNKFDWNPVMDAIIQVESGGNSRAISGNSVGAMQITPILVRECNNILKSRNSKKRFTYDDRYDVAKSKEMFLLIQSYHNQANSVEKAIRSWNGGPHYSIKATSGYYRKVMRLLGNR